MQAVQTLGLIAGLGRSSGEGHSNPLQYSCLGNSRTEEPAGLQSIGSQRVGCDLATEQEQQFKCAPFRSGLPILWISLASQASFPRESFIHFLYLSGLGGHFITVLNSEFFRVHFRICIKLSVQHVVKIHYSKSPTYYPSSFELSKTGTCVGISNHVN